ncbi:MAG: alpha/beta fold hydrolase, partial [Candidatus Odinarchaeota archaeon]
MKKFIFKTTSNLSISGKYTVFPQKLSKSLKTAFDVMFIHAFPFDSEMFVKNFKDNKFIKILNEIALRKGRIRIFLPDLPGFGESSLFDSKPKSLLVYADLVNEIANHFHINQLILGGCSMGGYIALEYLRNYSNNIKGLVLIDTKPYADNEEQIQNRLDTITFIKQSLVSYSENDTSNIDMKKLYEQDNKVKNFIDNLHSSIISL